jgi:RHS repeat-associated protein
VAVYRIRSDKTTKDCVASYTYDAHGHLTQSTDENGFSTTYAYSTAGDLASVTAAFTSTTNYTYDPLGRQTSVTTPDGQVTTYSYDALDRTASITLPKPSPSSTLIFVTGYTYDNYDAATGLAFTTVTDANGRLTKSGYDALGNLVQAIDAAGNVTKYTYQHGLLSKISDSNGNETTYAYTSDRDLSGVTFPDGTSEIYGITNDVLIGKTDRKGQGVTYSYDSIGRLTAVGYPGLTGPGGGTVGQAYTYDGQNLTKVVDTQPAAKTEYQFTYDSLWRRTSEQIVGGGTTTYAWSGSVLQSYTVAPGAGNTGTTQTVSYGYDPFRRVTGIEWSWIPGQTFGFAYNANGQYSTITFPNGQSRVFAYDNQGRLTNVTNKDVGGSVLGSFDYGYDYDWGTGTFTMLGQRTSVTVASVAGTYLQTGVTKYRYDARYQLTRADPPTDPYDTWSYDAIGNRTASRSSSYTYYKNGQNPLNGQRLRSFSNSPDLAYDADGNLTGYVVSPNMYTWDYAGRLTAALGAFYTYDYQGRRTTATVGNTTTRYISLGMNTIGERNTTLGVSTDYLFGPGIDQPLAKHAANGAILYYSADGLGSIALVTDANSAVTDSSTYDAWGARGGGTDSIGYTGREAAGSLWYYRARYYDPVTGRFLSEDPERYADGMQVYGYVLNNPINYRDPTGMRSCQNDIARDLAHFQRKYDDWFKNNVTTWGPIQSFILSCSGQAYEGGPNGSCDPRSYNLLAALAPSTECCRAAPNVKSTFGYPTHTNVRIECKNCTESSTYHTVATFDPWWRVPPVPPLPPHSPYPPPGQAWW